MIFRFCRDKQKAMHRNPPCILTDWLKWLKYEFEEFKYVFRQIEERLHGTYNAFQKFSIEMSGSESGLMT